MSNRHKLHRIYKAHIDELVKAFPKVFNKDDPQVLPIGIHLQLRNYVSFSEEALNAVLCIWTQRSEYKAKMACGGVRYDLDGNIVNSILDWEVHNAIKWVKRFRRHETIQTAQNILTKHMTMSGYEIWCKTCGSETSPYKIQ